VQPAEDNSSGANIYIDVDDHAQPSGWVYKDVEGTDIRHQTIHPSHLLQYTSIHSNTFQTQSITS
jgi:hypothetical protein